MATWAPAAAPQFGWADGMLALRETIAGDAYAGMPDEAVAYALNGLTSTVPVEVPMRRVVSTLLLAGAWAHIVMLSRRAETGDPQIDALIGAAITCVAAADYIDVLGTEREEDRGAVEALLAAFAAANLVNEATLERLRALMWRTDRVWDPPVTAADVAEARGLRDG